MTRLLRFLYAVSVSCMLILMQAPAGSAEDGLIVKKSAHDVSTTLDRLAAIAEKNGLTVFARIDHAAGAAKAGLELRPTQLLIFGNPKAGTPLMQSDQRIALDLPLKVAAWRDAEGNVWLGYWAPAALKQRYGITGRDKVFDNISAALAKMTGAAAAPE